MQKFNYHSHTYRCMHSDADMLDEDYIKDYIKMGFEEVAFTDHCPEKNIIDKRPRIRMLYDQRIEYLQSIQNLKEKYKDTVKFEVKNFPISSGHQFARMAAAYGEAAAKQGKFWEMHDKIFEGQKTWERGGADTYFKQYAEDIGLDMAKLDTDVQDQMTTATINADLKLAKELGVNATPTFFLNGKKVEQPENSVEAFSKLLDNALSEAGSGDTQN